ncbi:N-acylneuraminate cytidylyltransferase [Lucilia sericata]|uniref:N-acylneuraminate cytidylyltransferase n=1 Tax=Lucilia sericata TaxID=13632 RepID=UPI0018A86F5E|nr:N-acylneuraminate cytidylyltransferase [Lucilia sericata]
MIAQRITILLELLLFLSNNLCCTLNDTHAIILARGGSKGIKNKNLLQFNGNSILGTTIKTIKKSGMFENIWVSTDSDVIEMEALKHGALVYRRLHAFAQDHSSSLEAIKEFLNKHNFVKKFALFQCTSVFLKEKYIVEAVHKFNFHPCVFAAKRSHKLRWKQLGNNLILPLNFNPFQRPRRQDWEGEFDETGMFYFSTKQLVSKNSLQDNRCAIVEVDAQDAIEIDNLNDLKMAQCMLEVTK